MAEGGSSWLDIAGSASLASSNTMGPSVGAGTVIFGAKNTGSGSITGDQSATPDVYQDGRMSTDTTATSATAKGDGASASAASTSQNSSGWLSSGSQSASTMSTWLPWVAVGVLGMVSVAVLMFAVLSGGGGKSKQRTRRKGRK